MFDGGGHAISGVYLQGSANYMALFRVLENAEVRNLGIIDEFIQANAYFAGIAARVINSRIINCYVTDSNVRGYGSNGGGIAAQTFGTTKVQNCYVGGTLDGKNDMGAVKTLKNIMPGNTVLFTFIVVGVCIGLILLLINSTYGRAFKAIRDDEVAAEAMGINLFHHKQMAFVISSFFAGIGGALLAMYQGSLQANSFKSSMTYEILLIVVIGGMGSVSGSILASFLFQPIFGGDQVSAINKVLDQYKNWCFVLAFTSIGLDTNFKEIAKQMQGGKVLWLYVIGQLFNIGLTFFAVWFLLSGKFFPIPTLS